VEEGVWSMEYGGSDQGSDLSMNVFVTDPSQVKLPCVVSFKILRGF